MAKDGLGSVDGLWAAPYHYFISLRNDYLAIMRPPEESKENSETQDLGHGMTLETIRRRTR